jgi:hypothetical protein
MRGACALAVGDDDDDDDDDDVVVVVVVAPCATLHICAIAVVVAARPPS